MRAVANHFGISIATVFRYYKVLQSEGLLTTVWGSRTATQPAGLNKSRRVRGVVAMPVCVQSFASAMDERALVLAIQDELWSRQFAVRMLFHDAGEGAAAALANDEPIDAVVAVRPSSEAASPLTVRAVPIIAVDSATTETPGSHYIVDRTPAIATVLRNWGPDAVPSVALVIARKHQPNDIAAAVVKCAAALQLNVIETTLAGTSPELLVERLSQMRCGIVVPSSRFAALLAESAPRQFERLVRTRPVLLPEGAIDIPACARAGRGLAEALSVGARAIAARIVDDLVSRRTPAAGTSIVCASVSATARAKAA